jgi:hypothetical protein
MKYQKLMDARAAKGLADRLSTVSSVSRFDLPGEPQGSTIAHALLDLEDSFSVVLNELLPKLLDETKSSEEVDELLLDIGEELRHILYHIRDARYFAYLFAESNHQSKTGEEGCSL